MNDVPPPDYAGHTPAPVDTPPPPCAEDLAEVGDDQAAAHHDELGDDVAQPEDEHPYDPAADPDSAPPVTGTGGGGPSEAGAGLPSSVTSSAGTSGQLSGTLSTDGDKPWAPLSGR